MSKLVYSSELGDLRKNKSNSSKSSDVVNENDLVLHLRRLTSGKGRTIIEITNLPNNKSWCKNLAKSLKKSLGIGGAYKNDFIELHGEKIELVKEQLSKKNLAFKQIGG